jgi:hypothetical protein
MELSSIPADLVVPRAAAGVPAPGRRVPQTLPAWDGTEVHHALFLPEDWRPDRRFPVILEYAGNGGYRSEWGDLCTGRVEDCSLGYGISGGRGFLWVCAPFVDEEGRTNAIRWWGDLEATVRYCVELVRQVCERWGGDPSAVFLAGFSRGAIAASYVGLHDESIARLWRGFVAHSHYDGAGEGWGYPGCDRASARKRLARVAGRPQWVSHEQAPRLGLATTREWLEEALAEDPASLRAVTLCELPFRNHTDAWVLRDLPERRALREWVARVLRRP